MDTARAINKLSTLWLAFFFQVKHPLCVLYDQYMWYKITKLCSHTQLSIC